MNKKSGSFWENLVSIIVVILLIYFGYNYINSGKNKPDEIQIGEKIYSQKNLHVSKFSNGDPIPIAHSDIEWLQYCVNNQPACRMIGDRLSTDWRETGIIYNFWAIVDKRGLAPDGWSIMTLDDWQSLHSEMRTIKDNYYLFHIYVPSAAVLEDGQFLQLEEGGAWWVGGTYRPYIVGVIETAYGIEMEHKQWNSYSGFTVRCVKKELTFWEKIGL